MNLDDLINSKIDKAAKRTVKKRPAKTLQPKSWTALAKELGVAQSTISQWRRLDGSPKDKDVAAWKEFQKAKEAGSRQGSGRQIVDGGKYTKEQIIDLRAQLTEEQVKNQQLKNRLTEFDVARQEEGLVPISEAHECIRTALTPIVSRLKSLSRSVGPRANPSDPQLAEIVISDAVTGILKQAQAALQK